MSLNERLKILIASPEALRLWLTMDGTKALIEVAIAANDFNTAQGWRNREVDEATLCEKLNELDRVMESMP